jgi:hypothetical protein
MRDYLESQDQYRRLLSYARSSDGAAIAEKDGLMPRKRL